MKIQTDELNRQSEELRRITSRIYDVSETIRRVSRMLSRERFGEEFRPSLERMEQSVCERAEEISILSSALSQISQMYEQTETRILDEADAANIHFRPYDLRLIPFVPRGRNDLSDLNWFSDFSGAEIDWTPWEP